MWVSQKPKKDRDGTRWNFTIWYDWTGDSANVPYRLFFWNDKKHTCGVVFFPPASNANFSRLKTTMSKLVKDPNMRKKHEKGLRFPLERHYSAYGAFPEETA